LFPCTSANDDQVFYRFQFFSPGSPHSLDQLVCLDSPLVLRVDLVSMDDCLELFFQLGKSRLQLRNMSSFVMKLVNFRLQPAKWRRNTGCNFVICEPFWKFEMTHHNRMFRACFCLTYRSISFVLSSTLLSSPTIAWLSMVFLAFSVAIKLTKYLLFVCLLFCALSFILMTMYGCSCVMTCREGATNICRCSQVSRTEFDAGVLFLEKMGTPNMFRATEIHT
jgi:hypothetical protein